MKRNIVIATLAAVFIATGGTVTAFAAGDDGHGDSARVSEDEAIALALAETPGTVKSAEYEFADFAMGHDRYVWEIDILHEKHGRFEVTIDANTGATVVPEASFEVVKDPEETVEKDDQDDRADVGSQDEGRAGDDRGDVGREDAGDDRDDLQDDRDDQADREDDDADDSVEADGAGDTDADDADDRGDD